MRNFLLKLFLIHYILQNGTFHAYHFNKCDSSSHSNVLDTLYGQIKGECLKVPISYSNGSKISANVMNWLSVPYAEPPINENRFKNPVPKQPWSTIIDGTEWPKPCLQKFDPNGIEDCLYLNIFVRSDVYHNRNTTLVPILFFIHGGGLVSGTITTDYYEGSTLAAYADIIVVTVQYRLDSLGFLHLTNSDARGNQGFLDQHLALKWVYENARQFGGDQTRITIGGESAGAFAVGYHLMYEKSWPYFRNAIMESGGPSLKSISPITSSEANKRALDMMAFLGCNSSQPSSEVLRCAQKINATLILDASYNFLRKNLFEKEEYGITTGTHFPLVINNDSFKETIGEIIEKKKIKKCKIITGFNSGEFGATLAGLKISTLGSDPSKWEESAKAMNSSTFFGLINSLFYYYPKYPMQKNDRFVSELMNEYVPMGQNAIISYFDSVMKIFNDFLFICQSFEMAQAFSELNLQAYVYSYEHIISSTIYPKMFGAVHTDDLPMLFAETLSNKVPPLISSNYWSAAFSNYSSNERKFNEDFLKYWVDFIKYDDPNFSQKSGLSQWDSFLDGSQMNMVDIERVGRVLRLKANDTKMTTGFSSHKCAFWNYTRLKNSGSKIFCFDWKILALLSFCFSFFSF